MVLPIFTIVGAGGTQGGAVLDAALKSGIYKVRGITRNTDNATAKALAARGVEMVAANLDDEASLVKAFEGTTAIYAVTNFFEPFSSSGPEHAMAVELSQGQNLARAASKTASLKHYIWSTVPNSKKISDGKFVIPHFEAKNQIDEFIMVDKNLYAKTTFLLIGVYASNIVYPTFTPIFVKSTGKYIQLSPTPATTPVFSIGSISANLGFFTNAILAQPTLTHSRFVSAHVEATTVGGLLEIWGTATGNQTAYVQISNVEEYDNLWPVWGKEMGLMLELWGYSGMKIWSGNGLELLTIKELGIEERMVGIEEAYKELDWKTIL